MKVRKLVALILMFSMLLSLLLAGCGKGPIQEATTPSSPDSSSTPSSTGERVKLTMFMGDAGIKFPTDVDPGDNPIIKKIEDIANVDLVITKPEQMDFGTKFNLMMSSGEVLDIVHGQSPADIKRYGVSGAFEALDSYITKSPSLKDWFTPEEFDRSRADDGKIYGLFARLDPSADFGGHVVRYDLIEELNGGVVPATPEDWYTFAKAVKAKYPDSIPFSSQGNMLFLTQFFFSFGVNQGWSSDAGYQLVDGKVTWAFDMPGMKPAIEFYRQLYKENLIDKNFVTNKGEDFENQRVERNIVSLLGGHWAIQNALEIIVKAGKLDGQIMGYADFPIAPGHTYEEISKFMPVDRMGYHSFSIVSSCKDKDAGFRVIEAFCSPETKKLAAWGIEGQEYTLQDGREVLNMEASKKTDWRLAYSMMFQYWYDESLAEKNTMILANTAPEYQQKFSDYWNKGVEINKKRASVAGTPPFSGMMLSDDIMAKCGNMNADANEIIVKAVTGTISMDQFDKMSKDFCKKYDFFKQAVQQWYDANKK